MIYTHLQKLLVLALLATSIKCVNATGMTEELDKSSESNVWQVVSRIFRWLLDSCIINDMKDLSQLHWNDKTTNMLGKCLKRKGLRALDKALSRGGIAISNNIALSERNNDTEFHNVDERNGVGKALSKAKLPRSVPNWNLQLLKKITEFLKTRVLQTALTQVNGSALTNEGRRRHKGNDLGQMLMFGLVAAGLIVIPMGFQFLAVLGGKALLLAKLALILTSIQGLKKIATSNVNYGLYSTGHAAPWRYDRQWLHDGDPYSSSYPPGVGPQIVDHYTHSTPLPPINHNFNPRGEDYLNS